MQDTPTTQAPSCQASGSKTQVIYTSKEAIDQRIPCKEAPPEPAVCPYCGNLLYHEGLWFKGVIILWLADPPRCTCPEAVAYWQQWDAEQARKKQEAELAEARRKRKARIDRLLGQSGINARFAERTFDRWTVNETNRAAYETAREYAEHFDSYAKRGRGLYLEGTCGTGKTHLAAAIALHLIARGVPVVCKTSIDLLAGIRRAYDKAGGVREADMLSLYNDADLLIIDDLGKDRCTEWSMSILYAIVNSRYEAMRPTIITTNYNTGQLVERMTPPSGDTLTIQAIISRLRECTDVVTMAWEDYRSKRRTT